MTSAFLFTAVWVLGPFQLEGSVPESLKDGMVQVCFLLNQSLLEGISENLSLLRAGLALVGRAHSCGSFQCHISPSPKLCGRQSLILPFNPLIPLKAPGKLHAFYG